MYRDTPEHANVNAHANAHAALDLKQSQSTPTAAFNSGGTQAKLPYVNNYHARARALHTPTTFTLNAANTRGSPSPGAVVPT